LPVQECGFASGNARFYRRGRIRRDFGSGRSRKAYEGEQERGDSQRCGFAKVPVE
jgi:hypothetical protein